MLSASTTPLASLPLGLHARPRSGDRPTLPRDYRTVPAGERAQWRRSVLILPESSLRHRGRIVWVITFGQMANTAACRALIAAGTSLDWFAALVRLAWRAGCRRILSFAPCAWVLSALCVACSSAAAFTHAT